MSFASVITVTSSLLIFSLFLILSININSIVEQVRNDYELLAVIDRSMDDQSIVKLQDAVSRTEGVKDVRLVTKEEGLEEMKASIDNKEIFDGLELDNPLPDTFRVSLQDLATSDQVVKKLQGIPGLTKINTSAEVVEALLLITRAVNIISMVIYALLLMVSIFIITNTIRIAVYARRKEINIMKFIGATNSFIRWPFLIEGMVIGLIAAVITMFLMINTYGYIMNHFVQLFGMDQISFQLKSVKEIAGILSLSSIGLGVFSGVIGSGISVRKHLQV